MSKVLTTLDFDGAVSPIDQDRDFNEDMGFEVFRLGAFQCGISHQVLEFLKELKGLTVSSPERVSVKWATTWEDITERFEKDTEGAIPHFGYLNVSESKARAIADAAIAEDASLILVFEDHTGVHRDLQTIWRRDMRLSGRHLIVFDTKLKEGIQFSHILEAKSLIAAELGKGE